MPHLFFFLPFHSLIFSLYILISANLITLASSNWSSYWSNENKYKIIFEKPFVPFSPSRFIEYLIINRSGLIYMFLYIICAAQIRIFKTREIVSQTRRKYQKLPEILKRQQMERDTKIRRNHRILVNMFSKVRVVFTLWYIYSNSKFK